MSDTMDDSDRKRITEQVIETIMRGWKWEDIINPDYAKMIGIPLARPTAPKELTVDYLSTIADTFLISKILDFIGDQTWDSRISVASVRKLGPYLSAVYALDWVECFYDANRGGFFALLLDDGYERLRLAKEGATTFELRELSLIFEEALNIPLPATYEVSKLHVKRYSPYNKVDKK